VAPPEVPPDRAGGFHAGSVPMAGFGVGRDAGLLRTFLGSCIGIALHDRRLRVAGLAHVVLPEAQGRVEEPGKYADTAIPELLRRMRVVAGGGVLRPAAKLVGGARMFAFQSGVLVGERNLAAVERILAELGIPVLARSCGGTKGKRMSLDVVSGVVTVEAVGSEPETL
jgi:chemotaxis protein CheD